MDELQYKNLSVAIIDAAKEIHSILGSDFHEAVYQAAFEKELTLRGIPFVPPIHWPVMYKGELIGDYKADLVVDGKIVVEIKSVPLLSSVDDAQAIHCLTVNGLQLALLINFGTGSLDYRRVIKTEKRPTPIRD